MKLNFKPLDDGGTQGEARPSGSLNLRVIRNNRPPSATVEKPTLGEIYQHGFPRRGLLPEVLDYRRKNFRALLKPAWQMWAAQKIGVTHIVSRLYGTVLRPIAKQGFIRELYQDWQRMGADALISFPDFLRREAVAVDSLYFGLLSMRLVTDTGVAYLVDALQNITEPELLKFAGYGTGTTAESAAQTALVTELTTQYASDSVRPTGSLTEGASANIFRTVATLSPDSGGTIAITEHGIFSQAATGGGTLLDRSVFSAVNLVAGSDSLQTTYDFTITSGG